MHRTLAVVLALLAAVASAFAAGPDPAGDRDRQPRLTVRQVKSLAFGRVTTRGETGFITVDPETGAKQVRAATDLGGEHAVAEFLVRGEPERRFRITLPDMVRIRGREMKGARLQDFRSVPAETGQLGADGRAIVRVGATLRLPAEARGRFDESFELFVDYDD